MLAMYEGIFQAQQVVVIILVQLTVELHATSVESTRTNVIKHTKSKTDTSIML